MMTAVQVDLGKSAAKRQTWRAANPREGLLRAIKNIGGAEGDDVERDEVWAAFWVIVQGDLDLLRSMSEYWFDRNFERVTMDPIKASADRAATMAARRVSTASIIKRGEAALDAVIDERVHIALLDMILANGKAVREATRDDLLETGGWLTRVAARLPPGQTVADAGLSEADLVRLYESPSDNQLMSG